MCVNVLHLLLNHLHLSYVKNHQFHHLIMVLKLVKTKKRNISICIYWIFSLVVRRLPAIPVPPRSVIIERLPALPPKPRKLFCFPSYYNYKMIFYQVILSSNDGFHIIHQQLNEKLLFNERNLQKNIQNHVISLFNMNRYKYVLFDNSNVLVLLKKVLQNMYNAMEHHFWRLKH